jgi:hypothetical protein
MINLIIRKICGICGIEKDESEFHRKTQNKLHSMCKMCKKEYDKKWYKNNQRRRDLLNERGRERCKRNMEFIRNYKISKGCKICGYNKTYYALEFHHETDDKKYTVSKMKTLSIKTVMKEIEKCIVICANCHREIHHEKHEI